MKNRNTLITKPPAGERQFLPRLRLDIHTRLLLVGLVSLLGFIALSGIAMQSMRQQMIEDRVMKIRHMTEVAQKILQWQYQRFQRGEIDEASARKAALNELRALRYGKNEYFFVDDFNCISILLPPFPQWEGRDFTNEVDSNGHYFVQTQRDTALAGGGTIYYKFPKEGSLKSVDKAAYVLPFMPWKWLVGTGIYLDDVDQEIRDIRIRLLTGFGVVALIAGLLLALIASGITRPLKRLTEVIHRLTDRDYTATIEGKERTDEIGDIARALELFKRTGQEFTALQLELRQKEAAASEERAAWLEQQRESAIRLEQSSRLITVGELATSLAHELNQPLAAITNYCRGCVTLLEEGKADRQTMLEPMRKATEQAIRAAKIVTRIRTYLRRSEPSRAPLDLRAIIAEIVELAKFDIQHQDVRIHLEISPSLPPILADRIMIQQVVLNLIRNGISAMQGDGRHGRELTIVTICSGAFVETQVIDQGTGIDEEHREKIFTPFFTTKSNGMGMGLNICRTIIELHGGRLWASANPAGGAIFHFTLPLQEAQT
ncbi:cache domain-containing protein [Janthinobacterium sp. 17J80-10]|uniref:cache domain-containing protein n=1 Tax=Janthinobacterium sp. 17J80-10 TaxID=2497863 RepID=UPI0013E89CC1|nr:cache domain-containing protein [Janthinobacterium sp. 17J80-10]